MLKKYLIIGCCIALLSACQSEEKQAEKHLRQAQSFYETEQYGSAKQVLQELKTLFPKQVQVQRAALHLKQAIDLKEQERNLSFCDSMLNVLQQEITAQEKHFIVETTEYGKRYTPAVWNPDIASGDKLLKISLNDAGASTLTAVYVSATGVKFNQIKVALSSGEYLSTQVVPYDGGKNYRYRDAFGNHYEIVAFDDKSENGVLDFIAQYAEKKILLSYLGGAVSPVRELSDKEKQAIRQSRSFAVLRQDFARFQQEKTKAEKRKQWLENSG
ncbi:MAG: hypothetical protein LBR66_01890 [Candidatus Symbiothrix sp.]|jgi:hypothetical protein|nr:hypothetical protein [Candidatus Symbiothrix sp.]